LPEIFLFAGEKNLSRDLFCLLTVLVSKKKFAPSHFFEFSEVCPSPHNVPTPLKLTVNRWLGWDSGKHSLIFFSKSGRGTDLYILCILS
jgi:hypothetical protein